MHKTPIIPGSDKAPKWNKGKAVQWKKWLTEEYFNSVLLLKYTVK